MRAHTAAPKTALAESAAPTRRRAIANMSSRRPTNSGGLPYADIVNLHGSAGNMAVAQMLAKPGPPADGV
jgi:hypothetical protein